MINLDSNRPVPFGPTAEGDTLLLRETIHPCNNDLQLVISLLALQSRRATSSEARDALNDTVERLSILARLSLLQQGQSIEVALQQVCEALQSQAGPRGIDVSLEVSHSPQGLSPSKIIAVTLAVNELATNAIKHAFEKKKFGYVRVALRPPTSGQLIMLVDDDGLPFPTTCAQ